MIGVKCSPLGGIFRIAAGVDIDDVLSAVPRRLARLHGLASVVLNEAVSNLPTHVYVKHAVSDTNPFISNKNMFWDYRSWIHLPMLPVKSNRVIAPRATRKESTRKYTNSTEVLGLATGKAVAHRGSI
jgi:hypothetical protein